jgi:hypothetical protein
MVQSVCDDKAPIKPFTNIWILDDSGKNWIKAYAIPMAASASRYMPLRVMREWKTASAVLFGRLF